MESNTCSWCEVAPSGRGRPFCRNCKRELMTWDRPGLARLLGMLQTLANASKRMALFSREITEDATLEDSDRIGQVRALVCHWCALRDRCGKVHHAQRRLFPGPVCSNCGIPRAAGSDTELCPGCHASVLRLDSAELLRLIGSAAMEAVYWRTALVNARLVLARRASCEAQLRDLRHCLSDA